MKIGLLLVNLGTPDAPTSNAVKKYLRQFLSDPRVIDLPRWFWLPLLNLVILPKRSPRVAKLYSSIWTEQGSPLLKYCLSLKQQINDYYLKQNNQKDEVTVELAMTYGNPSMQSAVDNLIMQKIDKLIVLPLYPQYSSTTTASVFDALAAALKPHRHFPELQFIHRYYDHPLYIQALTNRIQQANLSKDTLLVFSFHGIPQRYVDDGDYYPDECHRTAQYVAEKLNLSPKQWMVTFQSRFGKEPWLQPYTDEMLEKIAQEGNYSNVAVICPGFSVDCLETLEEIAEENREIFIENGGKSFNYIPALNDSPDHIDLLLDLFNQYLHSTKSV